jgi:hypothetical protein
MSARPVENARDSMLNILIAQCERTSFAAICEEEKTLNELQSRVGGTISKEAGA